MLEMTSDRDGKTESGRLVSAGTEVEYCGHVIGGMVAVRLPDGSDHVMHPHCFPQLRPAPVAS